MSFRKLFYSLALILFALAWQRFALAADNENPLMNKLVIGNTRFALDLYTHLWNTKGNLFFSPYSISTVLAMTYAGAEGKTAQQMADVLHFPPQRQPVHTAFAGLQAQLDAAQAQGDIALNIANGLWLQQGHDFVKTFLERVQNHYQAALKQVDFQTAFEEIRRQINAWVERKTNDKIRELLKPGVVNALTRLVLVNAIYFKGDWTHPFDKKATQESQFWVTSGQSVEVPMMHQESTLNYLENDTLQVLELTYGQDKELSMIVLLPKKRDGLAELERLLTQENLKRWLNDLQAQKVRVYLPKFQITAEFNLKDTLTALGMTAAFNPVAADLSGIDGSKQLFISAVVHQAFAEVNEEGTEAAAATAGVVQLTAFQPSTPPIFRADHPFLFLIRENKSGSLLFLGRLVDPTVAAH